MSAFTMKSKRFDGMAFVIGLQTQFDGILISVVIRVTNYGE